ncbi:sodium-dependent transporter [uncultured Clostridium sp.]|uniref:sodium-dependent transporter n=1 Tax=uncultured Clostridium sp. TaxID=59620 RepID=UPI0025E8DD24|nr:sodium-dependent transporter [uncultured Clostridium sp.]
MNREHFSSRLGFIMITAACSIGLGNIWRFPYITGKYGGASFVLLYMVFLVILGLPIVVMEFAVGRASQRSTALSFNLLEPKGTKWHYFKYATIIGNYLLMMFYTVISGWLFYYFFEMVKGRFQGLTAAGVNQVFSGLLAQPGTMFLCTALMLSFSFAVCAAGLQAGVERITKVMMFLLFSLLLVLAVRSVTLPGAEEGLRYYLIPDFGAMQEIGLPQCIFAAMGQAFFTLSIGIGTLSVFGSRIDKSHSLTSDALYMGILDTVVALLAGLIIFPACFSFGVQPDSGPNLLFITMPNIFNIMGGGRFWGALFFLFMVFAAVSTVIAVIENIITYVMDATGWSRKKSSVFNFLLLLLLSLPCILGYNVWNGFHPLGGETSILDLEDFILSNNLLPLGSLVFLLFCTRRSGWGWDGFYKETSIGKGLSYPGFARKYISYFLPLIVLLIFISGYSSFFN